MTLNVILYEDLRLILGLRFARAWESQTLRIRRFLRKIRNALSLCMGISSISCSCSHNGVHEIRKCWVTRKGNQPRTKLTNSSEPVIQERGPPRSDLCIPLYSARYVPHSTFSLSLLFVRLVLASGSSSLLLLHATTTRRRCCPVLVATRVLLRELRNKWLYEERTLCHRHQGCINFPCRSHLLLTLDVIQREHPAHWELFFFSSFLPSFFSIDCL